MTQTHYVLLPHANTPMFFPRDLTTLKARRAVLWGSFQEGTQLEQFIVMTE